ncbi:MAG: zinc ABC transporter solute-binding protein, partial [Campylobacteraceae bacterium]|nr:zinc ABC transporter solute-binding protein [Campylobacteraceae bacterium]
MLKKFIILGMLGLISLVHAKINTVVSILPQKTFLKAIGGDKVNIALMVKPGNSPHTYEPKPSQMIDISKADIYFSIGIQFEEAWLPKFATQNKNMKIVNIGKSVKRIAMAEH